MCWMGRMRGLDFFFLPRELHSLSLFLFFFRQKYGHRLDGTIVWGRMGKIWLTEKMVGGRGETLPLGAEKWITFPSSLNMLTSSMAWIGCTLSFLRDVCSFLSSVPEVLWTFFTFRRGVPLPLFLYTKRPLLACFNIHMEYMMRRGIYVEGRVYSYRSEKIPIWICRGKEKRERERECVCLCVQFAYPVKVSQKDFAISLDGS